MSRKTHPLFITRGVPGTHDVKLLNQTIKKLKQKNFRTVLIPKFDKSKDDRFKKSKWQKVKVRPDGSLADPSSAISNPVEILIPESVVSEIETEKVDSCFSDVVASDDVSLSAPATPTFILPEKLEDAASATLARPIVETKADAINSSFFIITPFELMNIH